MIYEIKKSAQISDKAKQSSSPSFCFLIYKYYHYFSIQLSMHQAALYVYSDTEMASYDRVLACDRSSS